MAKVQHEQILQKHCIQWFANQYPTQEGRLYMNYNNPPSKRTGAILKAAALLAGVADLSYLLEHGRVAFIELKHGANKQSPAQKEFEARVVALGFPYHLCNTLEGFMAIIEKYNELPPENLDW